MTERAERSGTGAGRTEVLSGLRRALAAARIHEDAPLELMPDKGLAHHHVRLAGHRLVARIPKQSQMNLNAAENLRYQAACFRRASVGGHAPRLEAILSPSEALPRGALLVEEILGAPASLPRHLPAIAEALASLHALPLPAAQDRAPLFDPEAPLFAMAEEIGRQAAYISQAALAPDSAAQIGEELQRWREQVSRAPEPPKALIAFDAHPGNFLVREDGRAVLVDLEKARYGCPAFDLAHATLYTSTTWDIETAVELSLDEVVGFILHWRESLGAEAGRWDDWLILARRGMWLWSVTWCAKWKALADRKSDPAMQGEDWSADHSAQDLVEHVRGRVECYLSPAIIRSVRRELSALPEALSGRGVALRSQGPGMTPAVSGARLVLFAKAPRSGEVKTRLAAEIGAEAALDFYRSCLATALGELGAAGRPWRLRIAVTPDEAIDDPVWPGTVERCPQGAGDLGERMLRVLSQAHPNAPVLIVGSDIPELTAAHVERARSALADHDLVIGPSPDGGYWLIGARRPPPQSLFEAVRWSTPNALADTLRNASALSVAFADILADIDDGASFRRFMARVGSHP